MPLTVGTAGHIDHGKTWLVRALTGKDTDRLPEEKRPRTFLDSPFSCLAFLATLAAVSILIVGRLERMLPFPPSGESSGLGGIAAITL